MTDIQQYGVQNEYGDVFPATSEHNARFIAEQDTGLHVVQRLFTPWSIAPPPTDRQQVQSVRATSLSLIQGSKYPRDALYALLRQARQDVDRLLRDEDLQSNGEFQVEVTVRTIARPHSAPTAADLQAQGYAVGAPEPGER